jgi:hypothetical protein
MEADISIWQKPGHFYFALTQHESPGLTSGSPGESSGAAHRLSEAVLARHPLRTAARWRSFESDTGHDSNVPLSPK